MNFYSNAEQIKPSVSSEKGEAISTPTTENFFLIYFTLQSRGNPECKISPPLPVTRQ